MTDTQPVKGKSNRKIKYECTRCGRDVGKAHLMVKTATFRQMGASGRTIKSKVIGWLCMLPQPDGGPSCLEQDDAWMAERFVGTPGHADTKLAGPAPELTPEPAPT